MASLMNMGNYKRVVHKTTETYAYIDIPESASEPAYVHGLRTYGERRKGGAHEVMRKIVRFLNRHKLAAYLIAYPSPDCDAPLSALVSFYAGYGFSQHSPYGSAGMRMVRGV